MMYFLPYAATSAMLSIMAFFYNRGCDRNRQLITIACFLYFIFFFGFRGFIWHDWQNYYLLFKDMTMYDLEINPFMGGNEHFYEPGYVLLNIFVKHIYDDYILFQVIQTSICCILLFRFMLKRGLNVPFFLLLFLSFCGFEMLINLMRNSISILIILNALEYIEDRKPVKYFLMCLLALTFHISSIVYLPLYWILNLKVNRWVFLGVFLSGAVFFLMHGKLLSPLIAMATGNDSRIEIMIGIYGKLDEAKTLSLGFFERMATGLLVFGYYGKLLEINPKNRVYINALLLYLTILFFFNEMSTVSLRLGMLVVFGYWMIYYQLPEVFFFKNNKVLFCTIVMMYCLVKTNIYNISGLYEYENYLFGCRSYEESVHRFYKMESED